MGTQVEITPEKIEEFANKSLLFDGLLDNSTTDVVTTAPPKEITPVVAPKTAVTINGKKITEDQYKNSTSESLKDIDTRMKSDISTAIENTNKVASAINVLNTARYNKYVELYGLARTLSAPFKDSSYTTPVRISDTTSPNPRQ